MICRIENMSHSRHFNLNNATKQNDTVLQQKNLLQNNDLNFGMNKKPALIFVGLVMTVMAFLGTCCTNNNGLGDELNKDYEIIDSAVNTTNAMRKEFSTIRADGRKINTNLTLPIIRLLDLDLDLKIKSQNKQQRNKTIFAMQQRLLEIASKYKAPSDSAKLKVPRELGTEYTIYKKNVAKFSKKHNLNIKIPQ